MCILKHTLPAPDIRPISIQIPYYANLRKLCRYYNMFYCISFAVYNVFLSSYVVWRSDLLIHMMLFDGFILLECFVTPADISMGLMQAESPPPIFRVIIGYMHLYREIVECKTIIILTCHLSRWRFYLDPTTPT